MSGLRWIKHTHAICRFAAIESASMIIFSRWALLAFVMLPSAASAEPIKLKLSMITFDRSLIYQAGIKSFVDAVNTEARGLVKIGQYFSDAQQIGGAVPELVADGVADIVFIFLGYMRDRPQGVRSVSRSPIPYCSAKANP